MHPWKIHTPGRRQSKTPILSRNVDKKSLETEFSIAICRHIGDKWQSKTLFLSSFDPRSSIVDSVFICRLPGVVHVSLEVWQSFCNYAVDEHLSDPTRFHPRFGFTN